MVQISTIFVLTILSTGYLAEKEISFNVKTKSLVGYVYDQKIHLSEPLVAKVGINAAAGERVCNMFIVHHHSKYGAGKLLPFSVGSINQVTGEGSLVIRKGASLDYSKPAKYQFQIKAVTCGEKSHESELLTITLVIVPAEVPKWTKRSYNTAVPEGLQVGTNILQVKAFELGPTPSNQICKYDISKPANVPFTIDSNGFLVTTRELWRSDSKHYSLEVTAYDCWEPHPRKSSVEVEVEIVKRCKNSKIHGLPETKLYVAGSGVQRFALGFRVEACYASACPSRLVTAEVSLNSRGGVGQQCDLDPTSVESQRTMCGADPRGIALLNDQEQFVREADGLIDPIAHTYIFNGNSTSFEVPDSIVPTSHLFGKRFTLSYWLRHGVQLTKRKEQIVCSADGENHNRHHFSVFIHNCKLILLLRKEFGTSSARKFSSAEWRFKLPEVCDSKWHHYALSYEEDKLKLYVDGHIFVPTKENFDVVDDYPMHQFKDVHFTRLMVGACWRSSSKHPVQHLKGQLAGLTLVRQAIESDHVIRCLNLCQEQLDFHAMDQMNPGMSVSLKADLTRIIVNGHTLTEVSKLVRQIGYLNPRTRPINQERNVQIDVDIRCLNESGAEVTRIVVPRQSMKIEITKNLASVPRIPLRLSAESRVIVDPSILNLEGAAIFDSLVVLPMIIKKGEFEKPIQATFIGHAAAGTSTEDEVQPIFQIDSCTVNAKPALVPRLEQLLWSDGLPRKDGHIVCRYGSDVKTPESIQRSTDRCLTLLRGVRYFNRDPSTVTKRTFVLSCPELNGKYISNEVTVNVEVNNGRNTPMIHYGVRSHTKVSGHRASSRLVSRHQANQGIDNPTATGVNSSVIVVLSTCAGFFVLLAALAVVRLIFHHKPRGSNRLIENEVNEKIYRPPTEDEMEWDHTAMTITVNPMEMDTYNSNPSQERADSEYESTLAMRQESDYSCCSDDDVDVEEFENRAAIQTVSLMDEAGGQVEKGDLEWDNCSLPPFTHLPPKNVNV